MLRDKCIHTVLYTDHCEACSFDTTTEDASQTELGGEQPYDVRVGAPLTDGELSDSRNGGGVERLDK